MTFEDYRASEIPNNLILLLCELRGYTSRRDLNQYVADKGKRLLNSRVSSACCATRQIDRFLRVQSPRALATIAYALMDPVTVQDVKWTLFLNWNRLYV